MAALPEIDTYNCLGRFAKDPYNPKNILALKLLQHRVLAKISWESLKLNNAGRNVDALFDIALGAYNENVSGLTALEQHAVNMEKLDKASQDAVYEQIMKQQGYNIDMAAIHEKAKKRHEAKESAAKDKKRLRSAKRKTEKA